jgi:uncharacterized protein (TIGR02231 family)
LFDPLRAPPQLMRAERRVGKPPIIENSEEGVRPMVALVLNLLLAALLPAAQVPSTPPTGPAPEKAQAKPQQAKPQQPKPPPKKEPEPGDQDSNAPAAPQAPPPLILEQAPTGPESTITRVVVFPKHAEVTRSITVDAREGENEVTFNNLVPVLNPHTLRASVSEGARITGTELRTVYLKESLTDEITKLDADIQAVNDGLAAEKRAEGRIGEQAQFYASVKGRLSMDMGKELATSGVSVADWKQVLGFVSDGLQDCDRQLGELAVRVRDKQSQLETLSKQRKDFSSRQPKEMKQISVSFASDAPGKRDVEVHYIVDTVIWQPSYDVHLDRASGDVEITGYGQVIQWSGEHWKDVQLTLAMSRPDFELTLPELTPVQASLDDKDMAQLAKEVAFLSRSAEGEAQKWSETRFKRSQERETFRRNLEQLARRPDQILEKYGLSQGLIEDAMNRLVDRFAGVRYEIAQRETIPCDSSPHKVVAFTARMPAKLKYVAAPALGNSIMLEGAVVNTSAVPILSGSASLFIDDSYVGTSQVAGAAKNEPLTFGFGPDDSLVVTRKLLARDVKGPEAFRQSQVITYRYEITLENFNQRSVQVEVEDQIPISKTQDIQVTFVEGAPKPALDEQTGNLHWEIEIGSKATSKITYTFTVECPVGRDVHWE